MCAELERKSSVDMTGTQERIQRVREQNMCNSKRGIKSEEGKLIIKKEKNRQ